MRESWRRRRKNARSGDAVEEFGFGVVVRKGFGLFEVSMKVWKGLVAEL